MVEVIDRCLIAHRRGAEVLQIGVVDLRVDGQPHTAVPDVRGFQHEPARQFAL